MLKYEIRCVFFQNAKEIIIKEGDIVKVKGREWKNGNHIEVIGKITCIDTSEYECLFIENVDRKEGIIKILLDGIEYIEVIEEEKLLNANELRQITLKSEEENASLWWNSFESKLLKAMKKQAECKSYSLFIGEDSELNEFNWIDSKSLRDKVFEKMEKLGYKVEYSKGSYWQDGDDRNVIISWEE